MRDEPLVDLYASFQAGVELRQRIARRRMWQRRIGAACCIVSAFAVLWFLFQLGRAM